VAANPATNTVYVNYAGLTLVSVINGATNAVTATIPIGSSTWGVAVNPVTNTVYVTGGTAVNTVQVIDGATNTVTATIPVGSTPTGVAVNPATNMVYVANRGANTVSVIDGATNTVTATIPVGSNPTGIAVDPSWNTVYVANANSSTVSVIDGGTNIVTQTIAVPTPVDVQSNPSTHYVYVANDPNTVSVLAPTLPVGGYSFPIQGLALLYSYIGLASTLAVAVVAMAVCVNHVKRGKEKH
jgi:YVTN family beta-propeller protein